MDEKCFHGRRNGYCPWCARKIEYEKELAALDRVQAAYEADKRRLNATAHSVGRNLLTLAEDILWPFGDAPGKLGTSEVSAQEEVLSFRQRVVHLANDILGVLAK